jgi:cell division protein FtsB
MPDAPPSRGTADDSGLAVGGPVSDPVNEREAAARRRTNLTGRAAVLALVICLLAISLAYPLREYLSQRGDIGEYRAKVAAQEKQVAELRSQEKHWRDPAFVERQARERLHFVMPGETSYIVLDPKEKPNPAGIIAAEPQAVPRSPWFTDLWRSVEVAGGVKGKK